ncbi:metal ABC transporter substrate-binding protein [Romboutsia sp.]|uniref:metal ABC transporter substrate-binding protein n=1 Tax=Romboutsia sp. TaxID=1965302 RepID=UPI003F3AEE96
MRKNSIKLLLVFLLCSLSITGCTSTKSSSESSDKKNIKIITSFYPIYIFTSNITKNIEGVELVNLTKPTTGCLHDYSITTGEMKNLEDSDIFIINGANMESFMDKVIKQNKNLKVIEASKGIKLIKGENDELNPHVWLSISNAIKEVKNIEEKLIEYDPKNKEKYTENAKEYIDKLQNEKEKMHKELEGLENRDIVTFHEAFPYFAEEFNLNIVGVIEREPGSQPSAKELQQSIEIVKKLKVKALFVEPQYSIEAAQVISNETGSKVYTLDPIVTGDMKLDSYEKVMDKNLETLKEALK